MTPAEIPVTPDGDEAREWAERELSRPEYAAAEPTPLDRIAQALRDFLDSLFGASAPEGLGGIILIACAVLVVALIVIAFVIWGRPRAVRRAEHPSAALFGDDDARTAAQLRADAARSAAAGDFSAAIAQRTRALARGLSERGFLDLEPGATVHAFARRAAAVFPDHAAAIDEVADAFDDVRYLRRPGTRARYELVAGTDEALMAASGPLPRVVDTLVGSGTEAVPR